MLRPAIRSALLPAARRAFLSAAGGAAGGALLPPGEVAAEYVPVFAPQNVQAVEV